MNLIFFIKCHQEILLHLGQYQTEKRTDYLLAKL